MQSDYQLLDSALFEYHPHFLPEREADRVFERLWRELDWSQREITLFGRRLMQPRLIAWYGEPAAVYSYSGLTLVPLPWHPLLQRLKARVEEFSGSRFDSVLANAYRDGRDSMGWHSDDEKELGPEPVIASLSLGAPRRFLLRPKTRAAGERGGTIALSLAHGSMLLMKGASQQRFQHSLPRTTRPAGLRINLTYRWVGAQAPV
ncbi:MAG: alpha-ketoglutarate-dependent dioxygenase AlkB [Xanthomonadales bacterium]|jgi:alkylated DNA repair dioxygenase AlkB|nr:alpha-ketoglutarate-dependent dioxygenase AlkB [Xanthomonadales bacterium]